MIGVDYDEYSEGFPKYHVEFIRGKYLDAAIPTQTRMNIVIS